MESSMNHDEISFADPAVQKCPFAAYRTVRAQAEVYRDPRSGMFVVLGSVRGRRMHLAGCDHRLKLDPISHKLNLACTGLAQICGVGVVHERRGGRDMRREQFHLPHLDSEFEADVREGATHRVCREVQASNPADRVPCVVWNANVTLAAASGEHVAIGLGPWPITQHCDRLR
jgi:hypothetical protein